MKVLILWASKGGQTELLAERIAEKLAEEGLDCVLENARNQGQRNFEEFDAVVMGSPTYGSGDLHPDWDKTEREFRDREFTGLRGAAFGCGKSSYPTAFWAVDILENRWRNNGGNRLCPSLKVDTVAGFKVREADEWAARLARLILDGTS